MAPADTSRSPPRRDFAAMEADVEQGAVVKRTQLRDGATRRHRLDRRFYQGKPRSTLWTTPATPPPNDLSSPLPSLEPAARQNAAQFS